MTGTIEDNWMLTYSNPGCQPYANGPSSASAEITALEYSKCGKYIAAGRRNGKISIHCQTKDPAEDEQDSKETVIENSNSSEGNIYNQMVEFQSHVQGFDYLKSIDVEEKINKITWCDSTNGGQYILAANDKTINLWKIPDDIHRPAVIVPYTPDTKSKTRIHMHDDIVCRRKFQNEKLTGTNNSSRVFPTKASRYSRRRNVIKKRIFANAHPYHINSLSLSSDGESFLSGDDLQINLWRMDIPDQCFNIVDIEPNKMCDLQEVLTGAAFHPSSCNIMMYSTSRGSIKVGDLRRSAPCRDNYCQVFQNKNASMQSEFLSAITSSISHCQFSPDGRYIFTRDFLTVTIWDMHMYAQPVEIVEVHNHLKPHLHSFYASDRIFDSFDCAVSRDGMSCVTGSYDGEFHIFNRLDDSTVCLSPIESIQTSHRLRPDLCFNPVLQTSWHPFMNEVAVALSDSLFVYSHI